MKTQLFPHTDAEVQARTYAISPDGASITCLICYQTSHHPRDVQERFCSRCKVFHDDTQRVQRLKGQIDAVLHHQEGRSKKRQADRDRERAASPFVVSDEAGLQ